MKLSVKCQTVVMNLSQLQSKRKELQRKWDDILDSIKSGKIKDAARMMDETKVIRENLMRIKEAQAIANSKVNPNIFSLKDLRDLRTAIYKGKENGSNTLMIRLKDINPEIVNHKKILDSYNDGTTVNVELLILK